MNTLDAKRVLETALICAMQPMTVKEMGVLFAQEVGADTIKTLLSHLQADWSDKGVELVEVASGWRFQSRANMRAYLDRLHPEKPPKYSRAVLETLAIIAHRQPVTRAQMEDIRGVTINSLVIKQLEDRGWVEVIGHKETVGRPALFAVTKQFLDDLGLNSIEDLKTVDLDVHAQMALGQFDAMQELEEHVPLNKESALTGEELGVYGDPTAAPVADAQLDSQALPHTTAPHAEQTPD